MLADDLGRADAEVSPGEGTMTTYPFRGAYACVTIAECGPHREHRSKRHADE